MRSSIADELVVRALGAALYLGALLVVFLFLDDWGQLALISVSVLAGLASGRWWCLALAALVVPVTALTFSDEAYQGDAVSGPLDAALFAAYFAVLPLAVVIAIGVGARRLVGRRRRRAVMGSGPV